MPTEERGARMEKKGGGRDNLHEPTDTQPAERSWGSTQCSPPESPDKSGLLKDSN